MDVKYISIEEYEELWNSAKSCMRIDFNDLDPIMKTMTVTGFSGEGTEFENEYDRLLHKAFNPSMPAQILYHDYDGSYYIKPKYE